MKNIRIALVDSGISDNQLNECKNKLCLIDGEESGDVIDEIGHGTAVFYNLKKHCNAEIDVIKIFKDSFEIDEDRLIDALEYLNTIDIDIIHFSLGVCISQQISRIETLCKKLTDKGVIIVSAFDNQGAISYPSALKNVIGVDISRKCKKIDEYEFVESDIVNIRAFSGQQRLPSLNGEYVMLSGTSFAAPLITAKIAKMMEQGIASTQDEILDKLKLQAKLVIPSVKYVKPNGLFEIKKAVLFPFNKEMHSLVTFSDLLPFRIDKVCDFKYIYTIGKNVSEVIKRDIKTDFKIKNIEKINWDDDFDTLILGHMREINEAVAKDYRQFIIRKCIEKNKNIYAFDDLSEYTEELEEAKNKNLNISFPVIKQVNAPQNHFGKLYQISCPVVGVYGTSSRQGKFTVQLTLRQKFIQDGYKVGQIGTEPTALLFGMEYSFPIGYDSNMQLKAFDMIVTLNRFMRSIEKSEPDIIITGCQSQSVAYSAENLALFPIEQYNLLLGTQPDAIVLCVNTYDDFEYIQRTINFVESSVGSKVAALVVSPILRTLAMSSLIRKTEVIERDELLKAKAAISGFFKLPTFLLSDDQDMTDLKDCCVNYFSQE